MSAKNPSKPNDVRLIDNVALMNPSGAQAFFSGKLIITVVINTTGQIDCFFGDNTNALSLTNPNASNSASFTAGQIYEVVLHITKGVRFSIQPHTSTSAFSFIQVLNLREAQN